MTTDLKANHYILFNSYDYQKPQVSSYIIRQLFGDGASSSYISLFMTHGYLISLYKGLLSAEGDRHKHQV